MKSDANFIDFIIYSSLYILNLNSLLNSKKDRMIAIYKKKAKSLDSTTI